MPVTPRLWQLTGGAEDAAMIAEAAALLRRGGLVAFPTETVYGLGAHARDPQAIARLNQVKGRPPEKPYSIHLSAAEQVRQFVPAVSPLARRLMAQFWPGPLTIVIPGRDGETIGFRVPAHPVAEAFLSACGVPVVAPSANRSGSPPPTDAREVVNALGDSFDALLDGGPTRLGRESTVVELVDDRLEIRREGAISRERILELLS